jgi:O-antigen/teichoic acid export membrane protein
MKQSVIKTIARNYLFGMGAQGGIRLLSFLFSIFVVRGLGPEEFGKYTQVLAYMAIFSIFGDLGVSNFASREIAKQHEASRNFFWNVRVLRIILGFLVVSLSTSSAYLLGRSPEIILGVFISSLSVFFFAFQGTVEIVLTGYERVDYVSMLMVLSQTLYLVFGIIVMLNHWGYIGLIFATWPGAIISTIVGGKLIRKKLKADVPLNIEINQWPKLIKSGIPFGVITFTNMLSFKVDTILLGIWVSDAQVGYYNAAYNLIFTLLTFTNTLNSTLLPTLSRLFVTDSNRTQIIYHKAIQYLAIFSLPVAFGTTILAKEIIQTLYGEQMMGAVLPLQILIWVLPVLVITSLCGSITTVFHLERQSARVNAVNAVFNLLLNLLVIPFFGIIGASLATVLTEMVGFGQFIKILSKQFNWPQLLKSLIKPLVACLIMSVGVFFVYKTIHMWAILLGVGLYIIACYVVRMDNISEIRTMSRLLVVNIFGKNFIGNKP